MHPGWARIWSIAARSKVSQIGMGSLGARPPICFLKAVVISIACLSVITLFIKVRFEFKGKLKIEIEKCNIVNTVKNTVEIQ